MANESWGHSTREITNLEPVPNRISRNWRPGMEKEQGQRELVKQFHGQSFPRGPIRVIDEVSRRWFLPWNAFFMSTVGLPLHLRVCLSLLYSFGAGAGRSQPAAGAKADITFYGTVSLL